MQSDSQMEVQEEPSLTSDRITVVERSLQEDVNANPRALLGENVIDMTDSGTCDKVATREASIEANESLAEDSTPVELFNESANESETSQQTIDVLDDLLDNVKTNDFMRSLDFDDVPMKVTGTVKEFNQNKCFNNFTKGCKWSPDGLCILTNSDDNVLRLFNSPSESSLRKDWSEIPAELFPALSMKESGTIYDYCWYPAMTSADPISCCLVCTSRHNPVHMWDAYTGEIRCTYKSYNHLDQLVSALSIAFSDDGQKIYCGFNKYIRIFDIGIPGRMCIERNLKDSSLGIISCIAVNPCDSNLYAAGSYSRAVSLYDESNGQEVFSLTGQIGGITHIMFSTDGIKLYTGGRKDSEILCWDLRNPGETLYVLKREASTNQRMYFDIDRSGKYLMSGNTNGNVIVWDTQSSVKKTREGEKRLACKLKFHAHEDCVNGVSFNPTNEMIATSGGQRYFPEISDDVNDDDDGEDIFKMKDVGDNSLYIWWAGKLSDSA